MVQWILPQNKLAVSSTEFCQSLFDEGNIREGLGGGGGHVAMIPLWRLLFCW
jgi:hypothetical protein